MNTRKGQVGVALAALLVVACGDAAAGMVMEDGGGLLVDLGMQMMDAGEGMDSAVAQGPGPWMNATCSPHEVVTTYPTYTYTFETWSSTFNAPPSDRWEVEACYTVDTSSDATNDGCTDVLPDGTTCASDGPRPVTTCSYFSPSRLPDGTVHVLCGNAQHIDYVNPSTADVHTVNVGTLRYRRL